MKQYIYSYSATAVILMSAMISSTSVMAETETNTNTSAGNVSPVTDQATELVKREGQTILLDDTVPSARVSQQEVQQSLKQQNTVQTGTKYDLQTLKANPVLFSKYLNNALAAQDMQTVKQLLPEYKALVTNDPMLVRYAEALVYRSEGKNKPAIAIYREMLASDPDFHPVRLNMALAMYADKQYAAAKEQLLRLQAVNLPKPVMRRVKQTLERIEKLDDWRFNASASYIKDNNINNAPSKPMQSSWGKTPEPKKANGLQLSGSASKRINLPQNYYATVAGNASLKGYWDEKDYNDYLLTASAGVGYDDEKNDASITPFVTRRIYGGNPYSVRKGVTLKGSRWIKPKLKLTATGIVSNETFDKQKDKKRETDGRFVGLNALYTKDAKEYFFGGVGNYHNDVPESSILTYDRNSLNVGWGREWKQGISTLTSMGYSVKNYDNPNKAYTEGSTGWKAYYNSFGGAYGSSRTDKTLSLSLQVWKRDLTFLGLTPRVVVNYETTDSNFAYYDDESDKSATVVLTKSF